MMSNTLLQQLEQALSRHASHKHAPNGPTPSRTLGEQQVRLLEAHLDYVLEQNQSLNLTAIREKERACIAHIEDSLTALPELDAAPHGTIVDMGTGGGFPGIPLAVVTGRSCVLVEATAKKAHVLKEFVRMQGLEEQISVKPLRAEELARQENGVYAAATARALSSLPSLMELAVPLLQEGGVLIAYKGRFEPEELERTRTLEGVLGMRVTCIRNLTLSDESSTRTLVSVQKIAQPTRPLPRRNGQAQRHPLA